MKDVENESLYHIYSDMPGLIDIIYNPAGIDCTNSVFKFKTEEASFYAMILSYSSTLHHKINGVIVSSCTLDYGVIETMRDGEDVNIYWPTIQDWVNMYGDMKNTKYVLNNVFMGETSLWEVIEHN